MRFRTGLYISSALMVLVLGCGEKTDSSVSEAVHTVESEKDLPAQPTSSPTTVEVSDPTPTPTPTQISSPEIQVLSVRVIETLPHDSDAFTQGLEFSQGRLFESRGLYGKSGISEINPNIQITLSSKLGRIGLLERENAALLNASLIELADESFLAFK